MHVAIFFFLLGTGESSQMFTAGNPGLGPPQKCPEPLPDLHHIQREVCSPFESSLLSGVHWKRGKRGDRTEVQHIAPPSCFSRRRLLIYGKYCSHVETAIALLDYMCKDKEDVRMKLEVRRVGGGGRGASEGPAAAGGGERTIDWLFCSGRRFFPARRGSTRPRRQSVLIILCPPRPPPAGMFKESKLRQVHAEGPAGGPHAASLKVPAPLAGMHSVGSAYFQLCLLLFICLLLVLSRDVNN